MYKLIEMSNVLPNFITKVRPAASVMDYKDDMPTWRRLPLDSFPRRLCSTQAEDKHIPFSTDKNLAYTKKEHNWCYDPTIKYESLRQCAVPRYAYCHDSTSDWSDSSASSDSETETGTMTVEEAQTRKDKILAEAKKEKPFAYHPKINYELLKQFGYVDSPDSFASPPPDSDVDTPEEVEARDKKFKDALRQGLLHSDRPDSSKFDLAYKQFHGLSKSSDTCISETETETEIKIEIETETEEAGTVEDKILAETKGEQLFRYDPGIKYVPVERYTVPRFAFFDSSSTDWSTSSDSESENETMEEKEAQSQEDKMLVESKGQLLREDLVKSSSTDVQSMAENLADSTLINVQSTPAFHDRSSVSKFIDLLETFDFTTLTSSSYTEKIEGLLARFPKYEKDHSFRTVLPHKLIKTADDYISMKFCTTGRFPILGIYRRRDFSLIAVCVEGNIMFALDDCDLHPSFVPDLKVHKLYLGIQDSHLASRETPSYTMEFMRSAISTLSLGYTPEKKNEWCDAIVLLSGMTTQAVRFPAMKRHIEIGPLSTVPYLLKNRYLGMQNRWNKISKAIRRRDYPYVYSFYSDHGGYCCTCIFQYTIRSEVSLVNDKHRTKSEIFKRSTDRWNGPLGNSKRKRKEQRARMKIMKRSEMGRKMLEMESKCSKRMHGSWYGSVDPFKCSKRMHGSWYGSVDPFRYEAASLRCLLRPAQMVRPNRFIISATSYFGGLRDMLQVERILAHILLGVKNIWNEGGPLALLQERGPFVQLGCKRVSRSLGETWVYPLQTRMLVQHCNATNSPYPIVSDSFRRGLRHQHEGLRCFYMTALKLWTKGLLFKK